MNYFGGEDWGFGGKLPPLHPPVYETLYVVVCVVFLYVTVSQMSCTTYTYVAVQLPFLFKALSYSSKWGPLECECIVFSLSLALYNLLRTKRGRGWQYLRLNSMFIYNYEHTYFGIHI